MGHSLCIRSGQIAKLEAEGKGRRQMQKEKAEGKGRRQRQKAELRFQKAQGKYKMVK